MTKEQKKLLIKSIEKWILKYEGKNITYGKKGCPLCLKYNSNVGCAGCPIKDKTGQNYCYETPYMDLRPYDSDDSLWWECFSTLEDKKIELEFLVSLLPPREREKYIKKIDSKIIQTVDNVGIGDKQMK